MILRLKLALCFLVLAPVIIAFPCAAATEDSTSVDLVAVRTEVESLKAAQAARFAEMRAAESRLVALEATLARLEGAPAPDAPTGAPASAPLATSPAHVQAEDDRGLQFGGDFRVRYEGNSADGDLPRRNRGVIRARLRARYTLTDRLYVGAMLSTGDPANPRTGDVTLSNFGADLQVKLAQAYVSANLGNLQLTAGKMPQPFQRTELVWDGDVNPQGVAASYGLPTGDGSAVKLTGLYFLVDESAAGPDSNMIGGQVTFSHALARNLRLELAAAYYDYALSTSPGANPADFRGNLVGPDGSYLSDFELADGMFSVTYDGFGPRWPLRLVGDYVRNLGAAVAEDSGFGVDLLAGRASHPGDWRLAYGYAQAGVDAVLGAFSNDNTNIPTNYLQHALSFDFVLSPHVMLNATAYHYRPKSELYAGLRGTDDWLNRMRLNFQVQF